MHNTYPVAGGEETVCRTDARLLSDRNHEVVLFEKPFEEYRRTTAPEKLISQLWSDSSFHEVRELLQRHRPDIMHAHNIHPGLSPSIYYAAKEQNVPVVQSLHNFRFICPQASLTRDGLHCEDCLGKSMPWPAVMHNCCASLGRSLGLTTALTLHSGLNTWQKCIDVFITPTEFVKSAFVRAGWNAEKIIVKPHCLYPDPGVSTELRRSEAVFVGRLTEDKGVHTLLKAWSDKSLATRWRLRIVGDGPLEHEVTATEGVEYMGRRSHDETMQLIGNASALIFPSQSAETFGMVVIEAFARGTPVIASERMRDNGLITPGVDGEFFQTGNADALIQQVLKMADDEENRTRLGLQARDRFENTYSEPVVYAQLLDIYKRALAGKHSYSG